MIATPEKSKQGKAKRMRGRIRADAVKETAQTIEGPKSGKPPTLSPGTKLVRQYRGKRIVVLVIGEREFEYDGKRFKSLSAIANLVSQTHCNGLVWFGVHTTKKAQKS